MIRGAIVVDGLGHYPVRADVRSRVATLPGSARLICCCSPLASNEHERARCVWRARLFGSTLRIGGLIMNQSEFETDLRREGYQVFYGGLQAGTVNADHSHEWDARVMVIGGEITLTRGGEAETFRAGDSCAVAAGEVHAEHVGPQGVAYIAGRRNAG